MEVVFYTLIEAAGTNASPRKKSCLYNCHLCKAKYSSYPDVEAHYLAEHKNVIVVLMSEEKIKIQRHFIGPKCRRPEYEIEKVDAADFKSKKKLKRKASKISEVSEPPAKLPTVNAQEWTLNPSAEAQIQILSQENQPLQGEEVKIERILDTTPDLDWDLDHLIPDSSEFFSLLEGSEQLLLSTLSCPVIPSEYSLMSLKLEAAEAGVNEEYLEPPTSLGLTPGDMTTSGALPDPEINFDEVLDFVLHLEKQGDIVAAEDRDLFQTDSTIQTN